VKILVITTKSPYPLYEGRALRTYNLLKQTAQKHEVYLLTFVQTPEEVEGVDHLRGVCKFVEAIPLHLGGGKWVIALDILRELFGSAPLHAVKYRTRAMRKSVMAMLGAEKFDVVHLDMLHLGEYLDLCAGTPVVLVEHNVESALLRRRVDNTTNPLVKLYLYYQYRKLFAYEAKLCQRANRVMTVSDLDAKMLEEMAGISDVTVISNGVDTDYFQNDGSQQRPNSLVFVGGLTWFPNLDAMRFFCSEILPRVATHIPDVSLTIVGKNPEGAGIREIFENPRVRLAGMVEDIRPIVSAAAAYIVPLRIGGGTRLKILDALSMGKALISTSVGCEGLDVVSGEHLLVEDSPEGFAAAVVRALREPELRHSLGNTGRELVKRKYEWNVIARDLDHLYESCRHNVPRIPG
jgi:polysaccharide biosynthesis protein PslH